MLAGSNDYFSHMASLEKYGNRALIAGASEGLGAAFAEAFAASKMDLILLARNEERLKAFAKKLQNDYGVNVRSIVLDLSQANAADLVMEELNGQEIDVLVYNAALSYISPFETQSQKQNDALARLNMLTPMHLVHSIAPSMLERGRGAIILMASMAGFQGSGFLATYAASKAFNRIFAESLWYEWKERGVDVMACCAGATQHPTLNEHNPRKRAFLLQKCSQLKKW